MTPRTRLSAWALALCMVAAGTGHAAPGEMSYQGVIRNTNTGDLIDGPVELEFAIFADETGGTALWIESHGTVDVENGLYALMLGSVTPFPPTMFDEDDRYLEVRVDGTPLVPRRKFGSVAYSFRATVADALSSGAAADDDWVISGSHVYRLTGNVGIGTTNPTRQLHLFRNGISNFMMAAAGGTELELSANTAVGAMGTRNAKPLYLISDNIPRMTIDPAGNVGIGTVTPTTTLDVQGTVRATNLQMSAGAVPGFILTALNPQGNAIWQPAPSGGGLTLPFVDSVVASGTAFEITNSGGGRVAYFNKTGNTTNDALRVRNGSTGGDVVDARQLGTGGGAAGYFQVNNVSATGHAINAILSNGSGSAVRAHVNSVSNAAPAIVATHNGIGPAISATGGIVTDTITTGQLEITGGADLSERFEVRSAGGHAEAEPGMIACIDPAHPGELRVSDRAYDRRVAGIVSGAGGVRPGLLMAQDGSAASGDAPVALTGRVYCYVDASFGLVEPGDLLTTSDTPGHAMKVTDHARAVGAIIGKAMTGLDSGRGLVLVLVSLQ